MKLIQNFKENLFKSILIIIVITGFIVRLIGISPGYPPNHPDEPIIYSTALDMVLNLNPNPFDFSSYRFQYPGLFIYLNALFFQIFFIPLSFSLIFLQYPLEFFKNITDMNTIWGSYILGKGSINALFWGRYISAAVGSLSVVLVYLIGKELFNKYVGIIAAIFLSFNFRHVVSSHLSLIDASNSTFTLLALYLSILLYKNPTKKAYLLAGLGIGLSFGNKLYFFSFLPFLFAHLLISLKNKKISKIFQSLLSFNFFLSLFIAAGIFVLFNPFLFLNLENLHKAINQQSLNNLRYGMGSNILVISPLWYLYEIGFGREFSFLLFIGLVIVLLKPSYWLKSIFLLFLIIPPSYILLYYSHGAAYVRNFTSIIPFAIIFSSLALYYIVAFLIKKIKINESSFLLILIITGIFISFPQIKKTIILDYFLSKEWNSQCVLDWVDKNVKENEIVSRTPNVPASQFKNINYIAYTYNPVHTNGVYTLPELQAEKIKYLIVSYDSIHNAFLWWVGSKFWGMPMEKFDNYFDGLVIKELTRYQVKSCIKSWPSIDDNYSIIKIPQTVIASNYQLIFSDNPNLLTEKVLNQGYAPKYYPVSGFIPVKAGQKYKITAEISAKKKLELKQRDGLLRADFYEDKKETDKRGKIAAVSDRFFGDSWMEIKVTEVAPENVKWLRISFQAEDYTSDFQIKNLKVYISKDKPTFEELRTANQKETDNSIIYPAYIL